MRKTRRLLGKFLRLSAYLAVVGLAFGALGVKAVHAKGARAALALGEPLSALDVPPGSGSQLLVNGQRLHLASARLDATVPAVLDRLDGACRSHADGLADDLANLDGLMATKTTRGLPGIGVLRDEREGRGVVMCFAPGENVDDAALVHRLRLVLEHHDLSELGGLRYVAVHADRDGKSRVTATWSDERLSLDDLFAGEGGDARGEDPALAPRPDGARRVLTARVEPARYGAFVYTTREPAADALLRYDATLRSRQFEPVGSTAKGRAYRRGLVDVLVTTTEGMSGTSHLSIMESHYSVASKGDAR
jgi:hypothetical protein